MNITTLLRQGGPVMLVLLAMSVLATAIILAKLFQFYRRGLRRLGFVDQAVSALQRGDNNAVLRKGGERGTLPLIPPH